MDDNSTIISIALSIVYGPIILGVLIWLICFLIRKFVDPIVLQNSNKIKALEKLNNDSNFYLGQFTFSVTKRYDNKYNYLKVEPEDLFAHTMHQKIVYFTELVNNIKRNGEVKKNYDVQLDMIRNMDVIELSRDCHIPLFLLRSREAKLFKMRILEPPTTVTYYIEMIYRSPKGKVYLEKSRMFFTRDMEVALESVSRATLSSKVRKQLSSVERSEISDSLRYDILNRDGFKCVICGARKSQGVRLHVDHIVPVSKGGRSIPDNLRTLCERCNIGKGAKDESDLDEHDSEEIIKCPQCGSRLVERIGKYGRFYGCSSYPNCKYTAKIEQDS